MRVVVGRLRGGDGERALGGSPGSERARLCERLGASASGAAGTAAASLPRFCRVRHALHALPAP